MAGDVLDNQEVVCHPGRLLSLAQFGLVLFLSLLAAFCDLCRQLLAVLVLESAVSDGDAVGHPSREGYVLSEPNPTSSFSNMLKLFKAFLAIAAL